MMCRLRGKRHVHTMASIESISKKVGSVLIVGGGIGGIQAALDLADSGYFVYLVEESPAIGGVMPQLDKTFPTNDCSMCILSPKLVECGRHQNIQVMTLSRADEIQGIPGNFTVSILREPRYVDANRCIGCGLCVSTCPEEAIRLQEKTETKTPAKNEDALYRTIMMERFGPLGMAKIAAKKTLGMKI